MTNMEKALLFGAIGAGALRCAVGAKQEGKNQAHSELGAMVERYLFISVQRYGASWLANPIVILLFLVAIYTLLSPLIRAARHHGGVGALFSKVESKPTFKWSNLFHIFMLAVFGYMVAEALTWDNRSQIVPVSLGTVGFFFTALSLASSTFFGNVAALITSGTDDAVEHAKEEIAEAERESTAVRADGSDLAVATAAVAAKTAAVAPAKDEKESFAIHMDLDSDTAHLGSRTVLIRGAIFYGWIVGFMVSIALIGFLPTIPVFIAAFMRVENKEPWKLILPQAIIIMVLTYYVFGVLLGVPWPQTLLGYLVPGLRGVIPSV